MKSSPAIKILVRTKFLITSRAAANRVIVSEISRYERIAETLDDAQRAKPVRVPEMNGVDEDMRDWSFNQILEHNLLVNHSLTDVLRDLAGGIPMPRVIDPKTDVMPSETPPQTIFEDFMTSIEDYEKVVAEFPKLRGTKTRPHPVFGELDAHDWHCMFGLHLEIHRKQAQAAARLAASKP